MVLASSAAYADEAFDKCLAYAVDAGVDQPEETCTCYVEQLSGEEKAAYVSMDLANWDVVASPAMKEAANYCRGNEAAR